MNRVAVTGLGCVSPIGIGLDCAWTNLLAGKSGITDIATLGDHFHGKTRSKAIGPVPIGTDTGLFDPNHPLVSDRRYGHAVKYTLLAAHEALQDAGWTGLTEEQGMYTGVSIGSAMGELLLIEQRGHSAIQCDGDALSVYGPLHIIQCIPNMVPGQVSIVFGLKGPNRSTHAACATGLYSIEDGASMIRNGDARVVVTGSTESCPSLSGFCGFDAMSALSRGYSPETSSRPYDVDRNGFVYSTGSGIMILEDMEHAIKRGARIYAEYVSCGMTADAGHVSAPSGEGAVRAMRKALAKAGLSISEIDHINAHATSTKKGDVTEIESIREVFGSRVGQIPITANKSVLGHMLNAASAMESVFLVKSIYEQMIPPTINLFNPDPCIAGLDIVTKARHMNIRYGMKNAFGFGGTNASAIFAAPNLNVMHFKG